LIVDQMGTCSFDLIFYYLDALQMVRPYFYFNFVSEYAQQVQKVIISRLMNATEQELRSLKKDRMDSIIDALISFRRTELPLYEEAKEKNLIYLRLGITLLN